MALGHDAPVGSAARDDESGMELATLEAELRKATQAESIAVEAAERAIQERTSLQRKVLKVRRDLAKAEIQAAAHLSNAEVESAVREARTAIEAGAGIVVEVGNSHSWGRGLEAQLKTARERGGAGTIPAVIAIRGHDATSHQRAGGVGLFLDLSGRLPQPESTLTAAELARRRGGR